jgi:hypothetical protein
LKESIFGTYHWATKRLWHKLLEVRRPVEDGLFVLQARGADGCDNQHATVVRVRRVLKNSPERCDLGVKTAALAALGEMAALREEGVTDPLGAGARGVKDGESTLKRFFAFSFWPSFACS